MKRCVLRACLAAIVLCAPLVAVSADKLKLRDGRTIENVIAISQRGGMFVVHSTGRTEFIATGKIRFVSLGRVSWKYRVNRRRLRKMVDRVAEENWESAKGGASVMLDLDRARPNRVRKPARPLIERGAPTFRSMLLPGWGQYYQGRTLRGGFYFVSSLLLGYAYFDAVHFAERARNDLDFHTLSTVASWSEPGSALRNYIIGRAAASRSAKEITSHSNQANAAAGLLLVLYFWNIYDAFAWTPENDAFRLAPGSFASGAPGGNPGRPALVFSWSTSF